MSEQVNTTLQSLKQPVFLDLSPEFVFRTYSNTHLTHLKAFITQIRRQSHSPVCISCNILLS